MKLVKVAGLGHGWPRDARRYGLDASATVVEWFTHRQAR